MKKVLILIAACFIAGMLIVAALFAYEKRQRIDNNAFIRIFPPHFLNSVNHMDLNLNSYYIAGLSNFAVYLGNYTAPAQILAIDPGLKNKRKMRLDIPEKPSLQISTTTVKIDSPDVFMVDRLNKYLFQGLIKDRLKNQDVLDQYQFTKWAPISGSSMVIFGKDMDLKQRILIKKRWNGTRWETSAKYVPEKQGDGNFSVDGMLHYNPDLNRLVFLYSFRNQFLLLDTNLKVMHKASTIDTNFTAKIKIAQISSQGIQTYSSPPQIVNRRSCISKNNLFVHSNVKANNEDNRLFNESAVIDVYHLPDGKYNYSFYLPKFRNKKLSGFSVIDETVVAIYDHYLVTFKMKR